MEGDLQGQGGDAQGEQDLRDAASHGSRLASESRDLNVLVSGGWYGHYGTGPWYGCCGRWRDRVVVVPPDVIDPDGGPRPELPIEPSPSEPVALPPPSGGDFGDVGGGFEDDFGGGDMDFGDF